MDEICLNWEVIFVEIAILVAKIAILVAKIDLDLNNSEKSHYVIWTNWNYNFNHFYQILIKKMVQNGLRY